MKFIPSHQKDAGQRFKDFQEKYENLSTKLSKILKEQINPKILGDYMKRDE